MTAELVERTAAAAREVNGHIRPEEADQLKIRLLARRRITASGCWEWTGWLTREGYGQISIHDRLFSVHRVACEVWSGRIPDGLPIDHLCRNRACFNPAHLEPVTYRENALRGVSPSALHAQQTSCVHGHEFTPENTYRDGPNRRVCRKCRAAIDARRRPRKKVEPLPPPPSTGGGEP